MCGLCSYHYISLMVAPAHVHFFPLVIRGICEGLCDYITYIFNSIFFVLKVIQEIATAFSTWTLLYCDSKNLLQVLILRSQIHKLASTYFGVLHIFWSLAHILESCINCVSPVVDTITKKFLPKVKLCNSQIFSFVQ